MLLEILRPSCLASKLRTYSQSGIGAYGSGTQYVLASYVGDASHFPSQSPTVPLTGTALLTQTISFAPIASPVTIGVPPIALSATGGGTLNPVTFSVLSGPGYVSGNWLYVTGVGTIVVAADQAGNADYSAAPEVTQSVVGQQDHPDVFGVLLTESGCLWSEYHLYRSGQRRGDGNGHLL